MKRSIAVLLMTVILMMMCNPTFVFAEAKTTSEQETPAAYIKDGKFTFTPREFCQMIEDRVPVLLEDVSFLQRMGIEIKADFDEDDVCTITMGGIPAAILAYYPGEDTDHEEILSEDQVGKDESNIGKILLAITVSRSQVELPIQALVFGTLDHEMNQLDAAELSMELTREAILSRSGGTGLNASIEKDGLLYRISEELSEGVDYSVVIIEPAK